LEQRVPVFFGAAKFGDEGSAEGGVGHCFRAASSQYFDQSTQLDEQFVLWGRGAEPVRLAELDKTLRIVSFDAFKQTECAFRSVE